MNTKRITYQIIPFIVVLAMLIIAYWFNQWYFEAKGIIGTDYSYIFLKFNQMVPFIPETVYPYIIAYPFWALGFFYIGYRSKKNLYIIVSLVLFTFTIAGLTYFFFQTDVQSWRETSGLFDGGDMNFTEKIVFWIYNSAGARNANPSMHCMMSWMVIIGARLDKKMPTLAKIVIWVIGLSICISTQTLKQHYIIDLITGIALVEGFYWILKNSKIVISIQNFFSKINQKLHLDWKE